MKTTKLKLALAAIVLLALLPALARAQGSVPTTVSYQGRVTVGGEPFQGDGLFKFAILDTQGRSTWSNDGTSSDGCEPADFVGLWVEQGLFNVLLGDSGLMEGLSAEVFADPNTFLRVWFSPDWGEFIQLDDRPIAAVPYAFRVAEHDHWGETWSGSGTGLSLNSSGWGIDVSTGSSSQYATAIRGQASSSSGETVGVWGSTESESNGTVGVWGQAGKSNGIGFGVLGQTFSNNSDSAGVKGTATSGAGVHGSAAATGVKGVATNTSGNARGVYGESPSSGGAGVYGKATATTGSGAGIVGESDSPEGAGVAGYADASSGTTNGVYGRSYSGTEGSYGGHFTGYGGVYGKGTGYNGPGVRGESVDDCGGYFTSTNWIGVRVAAGRTGVQVDSASDDGLYVRSAGDHGVRVGSAGNYGVHATGGSDSGDYGGYFAGYSGVYGHANSPDGYGVYSDGNAHVEGKLTWKAKTGFISVAPAAFRPARHDKQFTNDGYILDHDVGITELVDFYAPVQLPYNATVKRLTAYWYLGRPFDETYGHFRLFRNDFTLVGQQVMASLVNCLGPYDTTCSTSTTSISHSVVDNSDYTYYLWLSMVADLQFLGAIIAYEYSEPY